MDVPTVVRSGEKYRTVQGFAAVRDGIKARPVARAGVPVEGAPSARLPKPGWLKAQLPTDPRYYQTRGIVNEHRLATVCEESKCPNIGECWSHGTATIMLMGSVCTRACRFCSVDTGNPRGWLDPDEPANAARSVSLMQLQYVVLTSVDRDDLPDGGAAHYAQCVRAIRDANPDTAVEALTPDFQGQRQAVAVVAQSGLQVFAQNLETVERLTHTVRDARAGYRQTLDVLAHAKAVAPDVLTKTSLMLGLGESRDEVLAALRDVRAAGVDIVTFGQYLQPTANHLPVARYVPPEEFTQLREDGLALGFMEVVSGPMVRSSYRADRVFAKDNCGV
ncbi:MAG: lipoyl synthase [Oceanococcaceae bacterium]